MARFYGTIGFVTTMDSGYGVHRSVTTEHSYSGDYNRNIRRYVSKDGINDDINITAEISFVADPYALNNYFNMKYVTWMGAKWKVESVSVEHPRLILSIGGLYNEQSNS